ncbi:MAG: glycosyltransferase family 1 protein [Flavobacteriales bacterium]|nr:glycosyltransferase family 1 protein [Flavobacteriales bacterium]
MKIAVSTRLLLHNKLDGIGWFTYESFKRIVQQHPEHEFHFLFDRKYSDEFIFSKNVIPHVIPPQARHPILFRIWYDYMVPRALKKIGADVFISPGPLGSLRTDVPQLMVIHDLNFEHYPKGIPKVHSSYLRKNSPLLAKKAKRIATVSEFSKQDIHEQYKVPLDKIDVVYNGANENFHALDEKIKFEVRMEYSGGEEYFVFVSSILPRKNLQRILPAFDRFKNSTESKIKLVVVGNKYWVSNEIESAYNEMQHKNDVIFTGRLDAVELHHVLASSLALVYVSYFEGFGIPIVEAFHCGVPVITSNMTSMPEVSGDAALLVNPFSVDEISGAMNSVYSDISLRADLIAKGNVRMNNFSWQRTADLLWNSIEKLMDQTSSTRK